jgi:acylphosphatase
MCNLHTLRLLLALPVALLIASTLGAADSPTRPATQPALRRVHVYVSGQVQGVGFRDFTQSNADALRVVGWVRNLPDGRVEAEAEGVGDRVQTLLDRMKRGPAAAVVDGMEVVDRPVLGSEKTFEVRQ